MCLRTMIVARALRYDRRPGGEEGWNGTHACNPRPQIRIHPVGDLEQGSVIGGQRAGEDRLVVRDAIAQGSQVIEAACDDGTCECSTCHTPEAWKRTVEASYPDCAVEAMPKEIRPEAEDQLSNQVRSIKGELYPAQALARFFDAVRRLRVDPQESRLVVPCWTEDLGTKSLDSPRSVS